MRTLLAFLLVAVPALALAKPTIAVAPLEGDSGNKIAKVVAEVAEEDAKVIGPKETEKAMDKLGLSTEMDRKDLTKLRAKLDADAVVNGKLEKDGKTRTLELGVTSKGRKTQKFTLTFKSSDSEKFRTELREELAKRIGGAGAEEDEDEDEAADRKKREDEEAASAAKRKKKLSDDDEDADRKKKKRVSDRTADNDDDDDNDRSRKKKKKRRGGDEDEDSEDGAGVQAERHPVTQAAVRVHAGAAFSRRSLTYDSIGTMPPPSLGTGAPAGRIEGEIYPGSFSTLKGTAAAIGLFGSYEMAVGLKINVPMQANDAPISQSHAMIGARYRVAFGSSTIAFGVGYALRKYVADRSGLTDPKSLDTPDVSYKAVAPGAIARFAVTPTIGAFAGANALLVLSTGEIQTNASYGAADVFGFDLEAGVDVALAKSYGFRVAADFSQIGFKFKANPGTQASVRGVSAATDRTISLAATFAVTY